MRAGGSGAEGWVFLILVQIGEPRFYKSGPHCGAHFLLQHRMDDYGLAAGNFDLVSRYPICRQAPRAAHIE
jgi:hypothetical protein